MQGSGRSYFGWWIGGFAAYDSAPPATNTGNFFLVL